MQILVRFFTILREITGKREETLTFQEGEKATIGSALKQLSEKYGKDFAEYVFDPITGNVKGYLELFVNGQSTAGLNGVETILMNGDVLAVVPPVGGG